MKELLDYQKEITDIQYTINLLKWELKISTPKKAEDDLIKIITSFENKLFKLQTSENYEKLLKSIIISDEFNNLQEAEQRYIKNQLRHYENNKKVPLEFYCEYVELKNKSNVVWKTAKDNNDYEMFKPYLKSIIEMTKTYYRYIDNETSNLYDVMLNEYEIGLTSNLVDKLFSELKDALMPILNGYYNKKKVTYADNYTENQLIDCAKYLLKYIGFDMERGTLGIYPHGFTEKMSKNDIRIAFRHATDPFDFVTTIIHEGGHGIFEQNISDNLSRYENACIENLYALHESQSRLYENILGRNKNFWLPIYEDISKKLNINLSINQFVDMLNQPSPSLIRTEADELTYCMHIILRYEIERDLFNDKINIDELPSIWNDKMQQYLGIDVKNDADGLMQDVHWSEGMFGYFPSYLLGTIYDGMFIETIEKDLGSIDDILKNGQIKKITDYLINNIYKNGGAYTSLEIIQKMCQKDISVKPIIKYFKNKYDRK